MKPPGMNAADRQLVRLVHLVRTVPRVQLQVMQRNATQEPA